MSADYSANIRILRMGLSLLQNRGGLDSFKQSNKEIVNETRSLYFTFCKPLLKYEPDDRLKDINAFYKFPPLSDINQIINILSEPEPEEREKPKVEESSIPPELESMLAEYRENQASLEKEEIAASQSKTVAQQVQNAIKHARIREQALANRQARSKNEQFRGEDEAFTNLGDPKSENKTVALAQSYNAVKRVAFTYSGFNSLSPQLQNQIITAAVDLNTVGITDIDVAIQVASLQQNVANISTNFVTSVYTEVTTQEKTDKTYEQKIADNQINLLTLEKESKKVQGEAHQQIIDQIETVKAENEHLAASIDGQKTRLDNYIAKQEQSFADFEKSKESRYKSDPDLQDTVEAANKKVSSINQNLEAHGVVPRIYTPMDQAASLESAIRHDMPGELRPYAGFNASRAAATVDNKATRSPDLSPQAILFYGKNGDAKLIAQALKFAQDNPNSELGKLYQKQPELFTVAHEQLRKIENSTLGEEIKGKNRDKEKSGATSQLEKGINQITQKVQNATTTVRENTIGRLSKSINKITSSIGNRVNPLVDKTKGLFNTVGEKTFGKVSRYFNKIADKIGGRLGSIVNLATNPVAAVQSFIGQKMGQYLVRKIEAKVVSKITNVAVRKFATTLLNEGLKKALTSIAIKVGAKLGLHMALAATGPVGWAIDAALIVGELVINAIQGLAKSVFGEEIKARDIAAVPVAAAAAAAALVATVVTTAAAAAASAVSVIGIGALVAYFFYISAIVTAPLISTLAQLDAERPGPSKFCDERLMVNDKKTCNKSGNYEYCFPVNDRSTVGYANTHHQYPANDIMRVGDKPGDEDDVALPLLAYTSGTVYGVTEDDSLGGIAFNIKGDDGKFYYYAHNMCNLVTNGQRVAAGDVVGGMDSSGNAITTQEHVHFQISDQANMVTSEENFVHFSWPWKDFCDKLNLCI